MNLMSEISFTQKLHYINSIYDNCEYTKFFNKYIQIYLNGSLKRSWSNTQMKMKSTRNRFGNQYLHRMIWFYNEFK